MRYCSVVSCLVCVCLCVQELDFVFDQSNVAVNCSVDFLQESLTAAAMGIGRTVQDNITTVLGRAADTSQCEWGVCQGGGRERCVQGEEGSVP